jgi:hypothetical protein
MFLNCSTCFKQHAEYHQELKNCNCSLWFYICLWLPAAVTAKWELSSRLAMTQFLSSWWWAVCHSKHIEQLRNNGIINSTTWSHLVGYFYTIKIISCCCCCCCCCFFWCKTAQWFWCPRSVLNGHLNIWRLEDEVTTLFQNVVFQSPSCVESYHRRTESSVRCHFFVNVYVYGLSHISI